MLPILLAPNYFSSKVFKILRQLVFLEFSHIKSAKRLADWDSELASLVVCQVFHDTCTGRLFHSLKPKLQLYVVSKISFLQFRHRGIPVSMESRATGTISGIMNNDRLLDNNSHVKYPSTFSKRIQVCFELIFQQFSAFIAKKRLQCYRYKLKRCICANVEDLAFNSSTF